MVFMLKTGVYLHTAYAQASDGSVGFSTESATDAAYLGQYTDASATDATDPSRYNWTPIDLGEDAELVEEAGEEVDDGTDGLIDLLNRNLYDTGQFAADTQATGDRKVQTYFQPDEPDPEAYVFGVGDLWQDTDDGNHLYRWDGTAWVDAQDGGIGAAAELAQAADSKAQAADTKATAADEKAQAAGTTAEAVQTALNELTKIQDGKVLIDGGKVYMDAAFVRSIFAQDITATGKIKSGNYNGSTSTPLSNTAGSILKLDTGEFNFGGGALVYDESGLTVKGKMRGETIDIVSDLKMESDSHAIAQISSGETNTYGCLVEISSKVVSPETTYGSKLSISSNKVTLDSDRVIIDSGDIDIGTDPGEVALHGDVYIKDIAPYYEAGDVLKGKWKGGGYVTTAKKEVVFTVPLCKPIVGNPTITVAASLIIRQASKYTHGSASSTKVTPKSYEVERGIGDAICITCVMSDLTNAVNNDACAVSADLTITFS